MFAPLLKTVQGEYSGESAKNFVMDISRFHRIQASPGYRAAAQYVHRQLGDLGLEAEVITFPARYDAQSWSSQHFQEWDCASATLRLLAPESEARTLADFRANPMSIIQRSAPFHGELELAALDDGTQPADYAQVDVAGKMVFTSKPIDAVREQAVEQHGAAGILSDWLAEFAGRARWDLPDALQYTSFWWTGRERPAFGFVLSPREGERLRRLVRAENAAGRAVRVRADVSTRLYDGAFEAVTALLPGERDEEVVMVGHLCHPAPGGNDNASGAAATLEAARALQALVAAGRLPKPKRSIRFVWIPEMTGTYAYLAGRERELSRLVAGVNMDMVGENQELCGSSFLIDLPPEAMASFAGDLIEGVRDEAARETGSFMGTGAYALFRYATTPFGGGSDHYIYSDPSVGVPMPMLIQEPDKFYHTSADTIDKVDPRMLAVIGGVAATYAYWIASAGADDAQRLAGLMLARAKQRLIQLVQDALEQGQAASATVERVAYRVERESAAFHSLKRLDPAFDPAPWQAEIDRFAWRESERLGTGPAAHEPADEWEQRAARLTPVRRFPGPLNTRGHLHRLTPDERGQFQQLGAQAMGGVATGLPATLAVYWADGRRSLLDIARRVRLECGECDVEWLVRYFELLARMDLLRLEPTASA